MISSIRILKTFLPKFLFSSNVFYCHKNIHDENIFEDAELVTKDLTNEDAVDKSYVT